jgi:hypothetical protein
VAHGKLKPTQPEIKITTSESVQIISNPKTWTTYRDRRLSVPFPCAPRPYRSLTNKAQFQHIFKVESLLQISDEFSLLAPSVKSHREGFEGCVEWPGLDALGVI